MKLCLIRATADQSLANGTTSVLAFDKTDVNTHPDTFAVDLTNDKITVYEAGWYRITFHAFVTPTAYTQLSFRSGALGDWTIITRQTNNGVDTAHLLNAAFLIYLAVGSEAQAGIYVSATGSPVAASTSNDYAYLAVEALT